MNRTVWETKTFGNSLASLSDLGLKQWQNAYSDLENFSNRYLDFMLQQGLFPADYPWPIDPVHNPTRIWEYPYAYQQLLKYLPLAAQTETPKILDIGSALTFFPLFFASLGYRVQASDFDPSMERSFASIKAHPQALAALKDVDYATCDCRDMPKQADAEYDAVVGISVLEHVQDKQRCIKEFQRILKPKGILILTLDVNLDATGAALSFAELASLKNQLSNDFDFLEPDREVKQKDILNNQNYPQALVRRTRYLKPPKKRPLKKLVRKFKNLFSQKNDMEPLSVYGMALKKQG
ncbi:class I SAM-dependent methyltransferase [Candidatus Omnitrophota bacterium]